MPYIHAPTQEYPLTAEQVASAFPTTSFPRDAAARDATFAERGYHRVIDLPEPPHDPSTQRIVQHTAPTLAQGGWTLGWDVVALTQQEMTDALAAWRSAASVTMRQARLALLTANRLDDVEAAVAQAERSVQIEWEYATVVERVSPLVTALGAALGLDDAAIDALFGDAATR